MTDFRPTGDQLAYARERLDARRAAALRRMVTGEHIEEVARMVFAYIEGQDEPTPADVAHDILSYLAAAIVEPISVG